MNQKLCAAHPHIVHLREAFLTPHHLGIAMEYADSGDLLDFIDTFAVQVGRAQNRCFIDVSTWCGPRGSGQDVPLQYARSEGSVNFLNSLVESKGRSYA